MSLRTVFGLSTLAISSTAHATSTCLEAVQMQREATDMQWGTQFFEAVWPDGTTKWPGRKANRWADIGGPIGGGKKYHTYHREIRVSPIQNVRQTIRLKAIVTRVASDGRYSGDYTVNKITFRCESRSGEWRILDQIVHQRTDLVNLRAAAAFRASGGWDANAETAR